MTLIPSFLRQRLIELTIRIRSAGLIISATIVMAATVPAHAGNSDTLRSDCLSPSRHLQLSWPQTDFSQCTVPLTDIISGGPGKDGIPAIDEPRFGPVNDAEIEGREPVISLQIGKVARAYPLRVLVWHEIVNDEISGQPVAVTYCPLCNTAIVFDRRLKGRILDFGTTGNLRFSDLVMYDRQTESWFQQYSGDGLFGAFAGESLDIIPSVLESFAKFKARHPDGMVLMPPENVQRIYGANPYVGYDTGLFPFLFTGTVPDGVAPMEYVVIADDKAWALSALAEKGEITEGMLRLRWTPGQASALDTRAIADGRDIGTVTVERSTSDGYEPVAYKVSFAFVWHAFNPDAGEIIR